MNPNPATLHQVVPSPRVATKPATEAERSATCTVCGRPIPVQWNGRPRLYCGAACKQLAYRRRTSKVTP